MTIKSVVSCIVFGHNKRNEVREENDSPYILDQCSEICVSAASFLYCSTEMDGLHLVLYARHILKQFKLFFYFFYTYVENE